MKRSSDFRSDSSVMPGGGSFSMERRRALSLMGTVLASTSLAAPAWGSAVGGSCGPVLATPDQLAAERALLELLKNPELAKVQAELKAMLAASRIGKTRDGAATIDRAIGQWTNSLIFGELGKHRKSPTFLWGTDDTPRSWFGHELGGVGTSGDNPDAIYRTASLDGSKSYEVTGRIDRDNPAAQLVIQADRADKTQPASMMDMESRRPSIVSATLALMTDRDLALAPDGSFRITLGGKADGPNHIDLKPGVVVLGMRDMLSDWHQRPAELAIRERGVAPLSDAEPEQLDLDAIARHTLADLPDYVGFWSRFPEVWFGGLEPNSISAPRPRNKGWGYVAGLHFALQPGEAILVTTGSEGAAYTGFQLCDPWMIAPDASLYQVCLNLSQVAPNPDGSITYVISPSDPGVANWLDTTGLAAGLCVIRWQGVPSGEKAEMLLQDFRVIQLADLESMPGIPRVTPEQRRKQLARRAIGYTARTRAARW